MNRHDTDAFDILVVGGGQAGLAMGYYLRSTSFTFRILERHTRLGDSWRNRFDSLTLFTSRAYSSLPGLPVAGDPTGYPTKDEIADYLEKYAAHFGLLVTLNCGVSRLERDGEGFRAVADHGKVFHGRVVVIATGAYQVPKIPELSSQLSPDVVQFTTDTYRRPAQLPGGPLAVIGDGATGRQIAKEVAATRQVWLATGKRRIVHPQTILGKDAAWWGDKLGLLRMSGDSLVGRYFMKPDPFPGMDLHLRDLRRIGIKVVGRLSMANGNGLTFSDGLSARVSSVIWATGYRDDDGWIRVEGALDPAGHVIHTKGVSPVAGLFFTGRKWQRAFASGFLVGAGDDAAYLVQRMTPLLA